MPYIGKMEAGSAMSMDPLEIVDTWAFKVYWQRETDGKLEDACFVGSCDKRCAASIKKRLRAKLDDYVRRYASYAERKGIRYEVKCRERRERLRAKERAVAEAAKLVRLAAPDLLAALKAKLASAVNADELARAAIAKAEG